MTNPLLKQAVQRKLREGQVRAMLEGLSQPKQEERRGPPEARRLRCGAVCMLLSALVFIAVVAGIWSAVT